MSKAFRVVRDLLGEIKPVWQMILTVVLFLVTLSVGLLMWALIAERPTDVPRYGLASNRNFHSMVDDIQKVREATGLLLVAPSSPTVMENLEDATQVAIFRSYGQDWRDIPTEFPQFKEPIKDIYELLRRLDGIESKDPASSLDELTEVDRDLRGLLSKMNEFHGIDHSNAVDSFQAQIGYRMALNHYYFMALVALGLLVVILIPLLLNRHHALKRQRLAEKKYTDIYENISEGIYRSDIGKRQLSANPALVRLNGYDSEEEMLAEVKDLDTEWYVIDGRRREFQDILKRDGQVQNFVSEIYRHKTRERIWVEENARLVSDPKTGEPLYYEGSVRDVTDAVRKARLKAHFDKLAAMVAGCLFQLRLKDGGTISFPYASAGLEALLGVKPEALPDNPSEAWRLIHPGDVTRLSEAMHSSAKTLGVWSADFRIIRADGRIRWLHFNATAEREENSVLWHGHCSDITERKEAEQKISHLAYYDPLTHLANRRLLTERLDRAVHDSRSRGQYNAVVFLDIDYFKAMNDTLGHGAGDSILVEMAQRLGSCVRGEDTVSRPGGDEFIVVLRDLGNDGRAARSFAEKLVKRMVAAIDMPWWVDGDSVQVTCSIGATVFHKEAGSKEVLLQQADMAMYRSKAEGGNCYTFFTSQMARAQTRRMRLTHDLSEAIDMNELALHYQVQVDSSDSRRGAEGLLRWNHPIYGAVSPVEVIGLAETSGLKERLGGWVLHQACLTLETWATDPATADFVLAINVTPRQILQNDFVSQISSSLSARGISPSKLTLELPEYAVFEKKSRLAARMEELRTLGVRLALDDFGSGHASLSCLNTLPFDEVKLDISLIKNIGTSSKDRAVLAAIITIAKNLDLSITMEGVETEAQRKLLTSYSGIGFQGFYYGQPLPHEAFCAALGQQNTKSPILSLVS